MYSSELPGISLRTSNWQLLGLYLPILFFGIRVNQSAFWLGVLLFILITAFVAWLLNLRRFRMVADTPTSKVVSAPQGYVELSGRGKQPLGMGLVSYLTGLPCLWYRYRIEHRQDNKWIYYSSGESHDTFGLDDGSGLILIDPEGAEITTSRKQQWTEGNYRKTEWSLIEGEMLYVIGEHITLGGAQADLNKREDISALLTSWKQDKNELLKRFDRNSDGQIDLTEWEVARKAAELQVEREHSQIRLQDGIHLIRKPRDRRLFLIANRKPDQLVLRYWRWSWVYLGCALGSLTMLPFLAR